MNCPQCGILLYPDSLCPACRKASPAADIAGRQFQDPTRLTGLLRWLLIATTVIHVVFGACALLQALMLSAMTSGFPSQLLLAASTTAKELREGALGTLVSIVYFGVMAVFATWTYRMNSNIHALGADNLRFTPGWAVGWYFVPVANLWKPYQVMRELWLASSNPAAWRAGRTSRLVGWWWASWLACLFVPFVSFGYLARMSAQGDVFGQFMVLEMLGAVSSALGLTTAILAYLVVTKIGSFQEQAAERSLSAVFA